MMELLSKILVAAIVPLSTALVGVLVEFIRAKTKTLKRNQLWSIVTAVVDAVEQTYGNEEAHFKFDSAKDVLTNIAKSMGLKLSDAEAMALIEAGVRNMKLVMAGLR